MITRKTVIDQIELTREGAISIRFGLLLIEDGEQTDRQWHRTTIPPGVDLDKQLALVSAHLIFMKKSPIDDLEQVDVLKKIVALVHTPEKIAQYRKNLIQ